jgi:hypothetical protein
MTRPWRDIYPVDFWVSLVNRYQASYHGGGMESVTLTKGRRVRSIAHNAVRRMGLTQDEDVDAQPPQARRNSIGHNQPPPLPPRSTVERYRNRFAILPEEIARITALLRDYHAVPKPMLSYFKRRIALLKGISQISRQYCDKYGISRTEPTQYDGQQTTTSMDAYVWSIGVLASRKAGYLEALRRFYGSAEGRRYQEPAALLEFIRSGQHVIDGFAHLKCRMERLDPFHRSWEFHIRQDGVVTGSEGSGAMELAFLEWVGLYHPNEGMKFDPRSAPNWNTLTVEETEPFFVWLEDHSVCLGGSEFGEAEGVIYSGHGPNKVIGAVERIEWLVPSSEGTMMAMPMDNLLSKEGLTPFDTLRFNGKPGVGEGQTAAYVWTRCGTLLAGDHQENKLHHSSFVSGDSVRCAGMIKVEQGKVSYVSNNSGHYKPSNDNLRQFCTWLRDRNVCTPDVMIREMRPGDASAVVTPGGAAVARYEARQRREVGIKAIELQNKLRILGKHVAQAVQTYKKRFGGTFGKLRRQSQQSADAVKYFETVFGGDISAAQSAEYDERYLYLVPIQTIEALLSKPGSPPLATIASRAQSMGSVSGQRFSANIGQLQPLSNPSDLHKALSAAYDAWKTETGYVGLS